MTPQGVVLILCTDMMGSTDSSSAETTYKIHMHSGNFCGLIAGQVASARELVSACLVELDAPPAISKFSEVLTRVRAGIANYKNAFADSHVQSRFGISYLEFRKSGRSAFPADVFREVSWEIKNHYSQAELAIAGFIDKAPMIVKVAGDTAWECDDFAVIGSGTAIGESSLFHREHNHHYGLDQSIYHVYEAKRLAEKAPSVGKKTMLFVVGPGGDMQTLRPSGFKILDEYFQRLSPRPVAVKEDISSSLYSVQRQRYQG